MRRQVSPSAPGDANRHITSTQPKAARRGKWLQQAAPIAHGPICVRNITLGGNLAQGAARSLPPPRNCQAHVRRCSPGTSLGTVGRSRMITVCASGSGGSSSAASETTSSSWSDERSTDAGDVVGVENSVELRGMPKACCAPGPTTTAAVQCGAGQHIQHQAGLQCGHLTGRAVESTNNPHIKLTSAVCAWPGGCARFQRRRPAAGSPPPCGSQLCTWSAA